MTKLSTLVSRRLVISVVFGLSVSSCASFTANDYPKLIDEVERQIETGMDVSDASKGWRGGVSRVVTDPCTKPMRHFYGNVLGS